MGRFIRIVKADEDESEEEREARLERQKEMQQAQGQAFRDANQNKKRVMTDEARIRMGRMALSDYFKELRDDPPRVIDEETGEEKVAIDDAALYDSIVFANNILFGEKFGLDENAMYNAPVDEEGNPAISLMSIPILTRPILSALEVFKKKFPNLREQEEKHMKEFAKEMGRDRYSLDRMRKDFRVPDDITRWINDASTNKQKNALLSYFKEKTNHPVRESTIQDLEKLPELVRVQPRQFMDTSEFIDEAKEGAAERRRALGEKEAGELKPSRTFRDTKTPRDFYQQEIFPSIDMASRDVAGGQTDLIRRWENKIEEVQKTGGTAGGKYGEIPEADAIALVQEELNKYMRVFLGQRAIGSAGRGGRFGRAATTTQAPNIVPPSFHKAAQNKGVRLTRPNMPDRMGKFLLTHPKDPMNHENRQLIADDPPENAEGMHSALRQSLDTGMLFQVAERAAGPEREAGVAEGVEGLAGEAIEQRAGEAGRALGQQQTRGRESRYGLDRELASIGMTRRKDAEGKSVGDLVPMSDERKKNIESKELQVTTDPRLFSLQLAYENGYLEGGQAEYLIHRDAIMRDQTGNYEPTYFSEDPNPDDFPDDHPWRNLSPAEMRKEADRVFHHILGAGRSLLQFKENLIAEHGMDPEVLEQMDLQNSDLSNLHNIMQKQGADQEAELNRHDEESREKYREILATNPNPQFLNRLARDLNEMRGLMEKLQIDPIDIAEIGMQFAKDGFTMKGYNQGFVNAIGRVGGDMSKAPLLRALYYIKRMNASNAHSAQRLVEASGQDDEIREHQGGGKQMDGTVDCLGCHPKHFMTRDKEESRLHSPDGVYGNQSAFQHRRVMVPQLNTYYDESTGETKFINMFPTEGSDDVSLAEIAHHVFGKDMRLEEYIENLRKKEGYMGKGGLKEQIKKDIRTAAKNHDPHIEALDSLFGLQMRDELIQPIGGAKSSAATRTALGHIFPSSRKNDAAIEKERVDNLTTAQFSGLVEALDILHDVEDGTITRYNEKKKQEEKIPLSEFNSKDGIKKFIQENYSPDAAAKRQDVRHDLYQSLRRAMRDGREEYEQEMEAWNKEYARRIENGDLTNNEEGQEAAYRLRELIKNRAFQSVQTLLSDIHHGEVALHDRDLKKGQREVSVTRDMARLHNIRSNMDVELQDSEGNLTSYRIVDTKPPRREKDDFKVVFDKPVHSDEIHSMNLPQGHVARNRLNSGRVWAFEKRAREAVKNPDFTYMDFDEYFKQLDKKIRGLEGEKDLSRSPLFNERRTQSALGGLMQAVQYTEGKEGKKGKVNNMLLPLLKEDDEEKVLQALVKLRESIYTDSDGKPIDDVFLADGAGNVARNFQYRQSEYLTGGYDTGGTGMMELDNNILLPNLPDPIILDLLSQKYNKRPLSEKEKMTIMEGYANEKKMQVSQRLKRLAGMEGVDSSPEEKPATKKEGVMSEARVRELIQNSHFDDDILDLFTESAKKGDFAGGLEKFMRKLQPKPGDSDDVLRDKALRRKKISELNEHWARGGPTACGTCGGHGNVSMPQAISFLRTHNSQLADASPFGKIMRTHIKNSLRPASSGEHSFASWKDHPASAHKEPHEFHAVACPECDSQHQDAPHGRCSDGVCPRCLGSGERDPDDKAPFLGHTTVDEDGNKHFQVGMNHNANFGRAITTDKMQRMIEKMPKSRLSKPTLALQTLKDNIKNGVFPPISRLDAVHQLNRERNAHKLRHKEEDDEFPEPDDPSEEEEEEPSRLLETDDDFPDATPNQESMLQRVGIKAIEEALPTRGPVSAAVRDAYHPNKINNRVEHMVEMVKDHADSTEAVDTALKLQQEIKLFLAINPLPDEFINGDINDEHPISRLLEELHEVATGHLNKDVRLEDGRVVGASGSKDPLRYYRGMFLTDTEFMEGIYEEGGGKPFVNDAKVKAMFKHDPELMKIWNRHTGKQRINEEDAEKARDLVVGNDEALQLKQLGNLNSKKLNELYDEFNVPNNQDAREHANVKMDKPELTWASELTDQMPEKDLNKYFQEGDGRMARSVVNGFTSALNRKIKPMWANYLLYEGMKSLFSNYDILSHTALHDMVEDANISLGRSGGITPESFEELIMQDPNINIRARNDAARLLGFKDENDLMKNAKLTNKKMTLPDGRQVNGLDFKREVMMDAEQMPVEGTDEQPLRQPLPKAAEVFANTVQEAIAPTDEESKHDEQIAQMMEDATAHENYPNVMFDRARKDILEKHGFPDTNSFREAMESENFPAEAYDAWNDSTQKSRMHNQTWSPASYDEMAMNEALHHQMPQMQPPPPPQNPTMPQAPTMGNVLGQYEGKGYYHPDFDMDSQ